MSAPRPWSCSPAARRSGIPGSDQFAPVCALPFSDFLDLLFERWRASSVTPALRTGGAVSAAIAVEPSRLKDPLFQIPKPLARPKTDRFARPYGDFNIIPWIAGDAQLAGTDLEDCESSQFDALTSSQCLLDAFEHRFDCHPCFGLRQARLVDHIVDDI
jgi:hypothetical protein